MFVIVLDGILTVGKGIAKRKSEDRRMVSWIIMQGGSVKRWVAILNELCPCRRM